MASFQFKLNGFPAANRDAIIQLVDEATGTAVERKPFLDGSLTMRGLNPGRYQVRVMHPNLINPIYEKRVRLFPQRRPTVVPVPVPEDLFRDTPIRDVPDADLGPVQQNAEKVRGDMVTVGSKSPGEMIRSAEWNTLVEGVADLAGAVLELSKLVAPRGHDHPEIAEKIDEVQTNISRFAESFGRTLLELQREVEAWNLRRGVEEAVNAAGDMPVTVRDRMFGYLDNLDGNIQSDSLRFTRDLTAVGGGLLTAINEIAEAKGDGADAFLADEKVKKVINLATNYHQTGVSATPEKEMSAYRRATAAGGLKLRGALGR